MNVLRKSFSLLCLGLLCATAAFGQRYKDMMENPSFTVYEVMDSANVWFDVHGRGKGSGWKEFERWRVENEMRFWPSGDRSTFDPAQAWKEMQAFRAQAPQQRAGGATGFWSELGPDYATNYLPPTWASGVGRVEAVYSDTVNGDTLYLGARMGGFWKSLDGGATWRSTTQDLPAVGVTDIAVHPVDHNVIYILTRHGTGYSLGLLKSTDYGETWNTTSLSYTVASNVQLKEMRISPDAPDTMYISTNSGILGSFDGGATWTPLLVGNAIALALKPGDPSTVYTVLNNAKNDLRYTTDAGQTWNTTTISANGGARPWLSPTEVNPSVLYFASGNGVWKSTDSGQNFSLQGTGPGGMMGFVCNSADENNLVWGGLDTWVSQDGGITFVKATDWANVFSQNFIHADSRFFYSWNGEIFVGTDGYFGKTSDKGATWSRLNITGTGIREFYRTGSSITHIRNAVGGSQDNGTSVMLDGTWYEWMGADGMDCQYDRNNPNWWCGNIQNGGFNFTEDAGQSRNDRSPNPSGAWITPVITDPSNDNTIFIGYNRIYKSNDNGKTWQNKYDFSWLGNVDRLAIAESDSNRLFATRSSRIFASTDNGTVFSEVTSNLPNRYITDVDVDPRDPLHVAVTYSGYDANDKVYVSTNGGASWTNLTGNLPNLPANAVVFEDSDLHRLYVGMDVGVYYRDDLTGGNWLEYTDSLPAVEVVDLDIVEGANRLRATTFGRGLWEAPLVGQQYDPLITNIDISPLPDYTRPHSGDSVTVTATLTDDGPIQSATLFWGLDGVNFPNAIVMSPIGGDSFRTAMPLPPQATGTQVSFRIRAAGISADTTLTEKIVYRVQKAAYCDATGTPGTGSDYINHMSVPGVFSHSSGQDFYGDFSGYYIPLELDSSYTLQVQLAYHWDQDSVFAWADWNGDLDFTDAGEQILMGPLNAFHLSTGSFTVPGWAVEDTVRLRVRNIYDSNPVADPCGGYFGEVEDYSLILGNPPVSAEGLRFVARPIAEGVELEWDYSDDANVQLYEVQRSGRGHIWVRAGFIHADGQSAHRLTDRTPESGENRYRLRITLLDGSIRYSEVRAIQWGESGLSVFPLPANDKVIVMGFGLLGEEVKILDLQGRLLHLPVREVAEGLEFDVSGLAPGMYLIHLRTAEGERSGRFEVSR